MGLTHKQQIFVDVYAGNATAAARIAGYAIPECSGQENLSKPTIQEAIEARTLKKTEGHILTREERQQFWSDVTTGKVGETTINGKGKIIETPAALRERIKASELLGKSQADFIERKVVTGDFTVAQAIEAESLAEEKKRIG